MNDYNEQLLNEYLDGTLTDVQRQEAEKLLHDSASARDFLADLQLTFAALNELDDLPLMRDLSEQLLVKIEPPAPSSVWARGLILAQLVAASVLLSQLWPTVQGWLMEGRMAATVLVAELSWPQFSLGSWLTGWETAVMQQFQAGFPSLGLATNQWGILIVLSFAAWLAGNRLLFSEEGARGRRPGAR